MFGRCEAWLLTQATILYLDLELNHAVSSRTLKVVPKL